MNTKYFSFFILLSTLAVWYFSSESAEEDFMSYTSNPQLPTIIPASEWRGTPVDQKGRFVNLYQPFESGFGDLIKMANKQKPAERAEES